MPKTMYSWKHVDARGENESVQTAPTGTLLKNVVTCRFFRFITIVRDATAGHCLQGEWLDDFGKVVLIQTQHMRVLTEAEKNDLSKPAEESAEKAVDKAAEKPEKKSEEKAEENAAEKAVEKAVEAAVITEAALTDPFPKQRKRNRNNWRNAYLRKFVIRTIVQVDLWKELDFEGRGKMEQEALMQLMKMCKRECVEYFPLVKWRAVETQAVKWIRFYRINSEKEAKKTGAGDKESGQSVFDDANLVNLDPQFDDDDEAYGYLDMLQEAAAMLDLKDQLEAERDANIAGKKSKERKREQDLVAGGQVARDANKVPRSGSQAGKAARNTAVQQMLVTPPKKADVNIQQLIDLTRDNHDKMMRMQEKQNHAQAERFEWEKQIHRQQRRQEKKEHSLLQQQFALQKRMAEQQLLQSATAFWLQQGKGPKEAMKLARQMTKRTDSTTGMEVVSDDSSASAPTSPAATTPKTPPPKPEVDAEVDAEMDAEMDTEMDAEVDTNADADVDATVVAVPKRKEKRKRKGKHIGLTKPRKSSRIAEKKTVSPHALTLTVTLTLTLICLLLQTRIRIVYRRKRKEKKKPRKKQYLAPSPPPIPPPPPMTADGVGYGRGFRNKLQPWAHMEPKVYVSESPVHGYGLFARKDIKKNELICWYSGECISASTLIGQSDNVWVCAIRGVKGKKWCIDSKNTNNASGRWANHKPMPRCNGKLVQPALKACHWCDKTQRSYIWVKARKNIKARTEIFVDYGKEYWQYNDALHQDFVYSPEMHKYGHTNRNCS